MTNREAPNSNNYLPSEDWSLLTPDAKELWRKLPSDMRSIIESIESGLRPSQDHKDNALDNYLRLKSSP